MWSNSAPSKDYETIVSLLYNFLNIKFHLQIAKISLYLLNIPFSKMVIINSSTYGISISGVRWLLVETIYRGSKIEFQK